MRISDWSSDVCSSDLGTEWQDDEGFRNSARGRAEMIGLIRTSLRSGLRRLRSAAFMTLAAAGVAMAAPAIASAAGIDGTPGKCTGKFVNPVTDVCWSCLFPLSVGGLKIFPSDRPDTDNPDLPICACGSPLPRIGVAMGFWEPVRLADVTMKPWCFASLGGKKISPGFNIGHGRAADSVDGHDRGAKWHVHWYVYPLLYWMEILTDMACLEQSSFDRSEEHTSELQSLRRISYA